MSSKSGVMFEDFATRVSAISALFRQQPVPSFFLARESILGLFQLNKSLGFCGVDQELEVTGIKVGDESIGELKLYNPITIDVRTRRRQGALSALVIRVKKERPIIDGGPIVRELIVPQLDVKVSGREWYNLGFDPTNGLIKAISEIQKLPQGKIRDISEVEVGETGPDIVAKILDIARGVRQEHHGREVTRETRIEVEQSFRVLGSELRNDIKVTFFYNISDSYRFGGIGDVVNLVRIHTFENTLDHLD